MLRIKAENPHESDCFVMNAMNVKAILWTAPRNKTLKMTEKMISPKICNETMRNGFSSKRIKVTSKNTTTKPISIKAQNKTFEVSKKRMSPKINNLSINNDGLDQPEN